MRVVGGILPPPTHVELATIVLFPPEGVYGMVSVTAVCAGTLNVFVTAPAFSVTVVVSGKSA